MSQPRTNIWCSRCGAWCCYSFTSKPVSAFCSDACFYFGRKTTFWPTEARYRLIAYLYDLLGMSTVELGDMFCVGRTSIRAALVSRGVHMRNTGGRSYE